MSQQEKITIREVAAAAGVSVMTVSRVLRNERYVAPTLLLTCTPCWRGSVAALPAMARAHRAA